MAIRRSTAKVGRPAQPGPKERHRKEVKFKPDEWEALTAVQEDTGVKLATYIKKAALEKAAGQLVPATLLAKGANPVPVLGSAVGGPWETIVDEAERSLDVPPWLAEELELSPTDGFLRVAGASMENAGIPDGSLVLLRKLAQGRDPAPGDVALVQIKANGPDASTLKVWCGREKGVPVLKDGDGRIHPIPKDGDSVTLKVIGVARGVIAPVPKKFFPAKP